MTTTRDPDEIERALEAALARRPRHQPSPAFARRLRERLAANVEAAPAAARRPPRWRTAASVAAVAAAAMVVVVIQRFPARSPADWTLVDEAVSDHLRVVASTRPPEIESGGIHQVKPWFTGRVDFAPRVAFGGDADTPLVGGSLGYVRDRKAAVFEFRRRLHAITLLVFPAEGLPWPAGSAARLAGRDVAEGSARGFSVLLWREGDLGYALVSDVARPELEALVPKITP
jgi:anti-sigma factor RsiW